MATGTETESATAGQNELSEGQQAARDEASTRRTAVEAAAIAGSSPTGRAPQIPVDAQQSALAWFLSDEELPLVKKIDVNIGTPDEPRVIVWTITAINGDQIKRARKLAEEGNRQTRRARATGGVIEVDQQEANARIVVAGTIDPDLHEVAQRKMSAEGLKTASPDEDFPAVQVLKHRFRGKPGLIDQLAIEILALSGYDDDDIQEHAAGKA